MTKWYNKNNVVLALAGAASIFSLVVAVSKQDTVQSEDIFLFKGKHSAEEDKIILSNTLEWYNHERGDHKNDNTIDFVFVFSRHHCGNCVRDEVARLNRIYQNPIVNVIGFSLDSPPDSLSRQFNNSYLGISFPVYFHPSLMNYYAKSLGKTPVLYVIDSSTGNILDVHRPIPTDSENTTAFFEKWERISNILND